MSQTQDLQENPIVSRLRAWDAQAVSETRVFRDELTIVAPRGHLRRAAEFLREDAELQFTFLSDITATDRFPVEPRFDLNYHLLSMARRLRLRLKVLVSGIDPVVESVTSVWTGANWHEREIFDLFGVRFEGHPDLRRILMPDDWEGYPLRKDYPVEGFR